MDAQHTANDPTPPRNFWDRALKSVKDILLIALGSLISLFGSCIAITAQDAQWVRAQDAERMKRAQDRATQVFEDVARVVNPVDFHARVLMNQETVLPAVYDAREAAFLAAADSFQMTESRTAALVEAYFDAGTASRITTIGRRLDDQRQLLAKRAQRMAVARRIEGVLAKMTPTQRAAIGSQLHEHKQAVRSLDSTIAADIAKMRYVDARLQAIMAARIRDGSVGHGERVGASRFFRSAPR